MPRNACTDVVDRVFDSFERRDWPTFSALHASDVVGEDRRPGLRGKGVGRDEEVKNMRVIADLGVVRLALTHLEVTGDRLAVSLVRVVPPEGVDLDTEVIIVHEIDTAGLIHGRVTFERDEVASARDEMMLRSRAST